jgi:IS5 family transposase
MQISAFLDAHPELEARVEPEVLDQGVSPRIGRAGMSADQILRVLVIKQMNQFSYEELAFHLADSMTYRTFCRFGAFDPTPARSTLQHNLRRISASTLQAMNRALETRKLERDNKVRVDSTPSRTNIHEPTDSSLLWDAVRVMVRLMHAASEHVELLWTDHSRRAKRRTVAIISARNKRRRDLYRDLLEVSRRTVRYAQSALQALKKAGLESLPCAAQLAHYLPLAQRVIEQTQRPVLDGQKLSPADKVLSIFEPDTDLIVSGRRDPIYGHKLCLTVGASSLVLDCVIEHGNPTDSTLAVKMIDRVTEILGQPPKQAVFDGGFSSNDNLESIKQRGVTDVAFSKHLGLKVSEMVRSGWLFKSLRRFRAGVEGCISFLKRCFGLARCTWRGGRERFAAYTWASILSANLLTLARHQLTT